MYTRVCACVCKMQEETERVLKVKVDDTALGPSLLEVYRTEPCQRDPIGLQRVIHGSKRPVEEREVLSRMGERHPHLYS